MHKLVVFPVVRPFQTSLSLPEKALSDAELSWPQPETLRLGLKGLPRKNTSFQQTVINYDRETFFSIGQG